MGQLAIPLMIASTVVSTLGAYREAQAEKASLKYNAAVSRNNAIYQRQFEERNLALAEDARKRGETEVYRQRLKALNLASKQQSAFASAGVDISVGSPLDLLGDTFQLGELDALTARHNASTEAAGFENAAFQNRVQADNYDAQAGLLSTQASNVSPFTSAFTTLLSGASQTAGAYAKMYPSTGGT